MESIQLTIYLLKIFLNIILHVLHVWYTYIYEAIEEK